MVAPHAHGDGPAYYSSAYCHRADLAPAAEFAAAHRYARTYFTAYGHAYDYLDTTGCNVRGFNLWPIALAATSRAHGFFNAAAYPIPRYHAGRNHPPAEPLYFATAVGCGQWLAAHRAG